VTVWETIGVFVGIPAGITAVLALGVYGKSLMHQPNRYRPGRPWTYPPTWFVPHPDAVVQPEGRTSTTAVGGASGEW
jgi:hypothetical protein